MQQDKNENAVVTEEKTDSETACGIKVIDDEGYDIEQFLCRCSNKTTVGPPIY